MITIAKPLIGYKEIQEVISVLQSGNLVQGKKVSELEEKFKQLCNTNYAIATNNGTSALHTALYAMGIKAGDEVITSSFSFIATANSILMVGAKPVFVDIDEKTFNIDPEQIESVITKKTKAIIAVNLYGQPAEYSKINKIAKNNNLIVIEDAAQSINAHYQNKMSGNVSDIACFSLYATKNITSGEGGMITTNKEDFANRAKRFRQHGQNNTGDYIYDGLGFNYRMTDISASIALAQFEQLEEFTKKRKEIANKYTQNFKNIKGLIVPQIQGNSDSVFHQYTLRITKDFSLSREEFKNFMHKKGIQTAVFYPAPLYNYPHIQKLCSTDFDLPIVEKVSKEVISLPIHPSLKDEEVEYIIQTIKSI